MQSLVQIESADRRLLNGIADVMADAARRSGDWLVCRPGCTPCCMGPFAITQLDALRLRKALSDLEFTDPERSRQIRKRAQTYVADIAASYPGDIETGELWDEEALPAAWEEVPCPVLNPTSGHCDLYHGRPVTCRTFGPVTRTADDAVAACELCYTGASDEEMAECAVEIDPEGQEADILAALASQGAKGITIIAYALTGPGFSLSCSPAPAVTSPGP